MEQFKPLVAIERSVHRQIAVFLILWVNLALSIFAGLFFLVTQFAESMLDGADRPATLTESLISFAVIVGAFISSLKIAAWIVSNCERPLAIRCRQCGESLSDFQRYDRVMRSRKCPSCSHAIVDQPVMSPTVTMSKSELLQAMKLPVRMQGAVFVVSSLAVLSIIGWVDFNLILEPYVNSKTLEQRHEDFAHVMLFAGVTFFVPMIVGIFLCIKLTTMVGQLCTVRCIRCGESLSAFMRYTRVCASGKCWICEYPAYKNEVEVVGPSGPNVKLGRAIISTSAFFAIVFSLLPNIRIEGLGIGTRMFSVLGWVLLLHFAPLWLYVGIRIRSLTDIVIAGVGVGVVAYWLNEAIHS